MITGDLPTFHRPRHRPGIGYCRPGCPGAQAEVELEALSQTELEARRQTGERLRQGLPRAQTADCAGPAKSMPRLSP